RRTGAHHGGAELGEVGVGEVIDHEAEGDRPLLDETAPEAGGPIVQLPRRREHILAGAGADAGQVVHRPRHRLPGDAGARRDMDDRGPPSHGAHRTEARRSNQSISSGLSSTPRPRVDDRISAMLRGPNSGKVGNFWCSTNARAIAVAGTPRSRPSSSARARRSKLSSL